MPTTQADSPAVLEVLRLLSLGDVPLVHWIDGDNLCDCLFQRIGDWNNPYLGRSLRVRVCCIWAELYKCYPEYVQEIPYYDSTRHVYTAEPAEWDSDEMDMPVYLWHRQLAIRQGKSLAEIREAYAGREHERPKRVAKRVAKPATEAEIKRAHEARLHASGWLLNGERLPEAAHR